MASDSRIALPPRLSVPEPEVADISDDETPVAPPGVLPVPETTEIVIDDDSDDNAVPTNAADDSASTGQLVIPPPLAMPLKPKPKYERRSKELMEKARLCKTTQRPEKQKTEAVQALSTERGVVDGIASLLPGMATLLGKSGTTCIGQMRRAALLPFHFMFICRAAFMSAACNIRLGIKTKRVIATAVRVIMYRQQTGLERILHNSQHALSHPIEGRRRFVHLGHSHLWDEVNCKFVWHRNHNFRKNHMGVHVQTIVQRGKLCTTLGHDIQRTSLSTWEQWIVQPKIVVGTSASACSS